ncbi:MAG: hypothetical protein VX589_05935 [Myxococcota bacterium]|nr:hypothetical protein [Myxococcota bacterium]
MKALFRSSSCLSLVAFGLIIGPMGCGGASSKRKRPSVCDLGLKRLKGEIGPEFGRVKQRLMVKREKRRAHSCAIVFRRMAEETADELPEGERLEYEVDDRLALINTAGRRGLRHFRRVRPSRTAPGGVAIKLRAVDVNDDGIQDFIVEEQATVRGSSIGYKGLRIFDGGLGPSPEILSVPLNMKTKEGLEIISSWRIVPGPKGASMILLQGAGEKTTYQNDQSARRFMKMAAPPPATTTKKTPAAKPATSQTPPAKTPSSKTDAKKDELPDFLQLSP